MSLSKPVGKRKNFFTKECVEKRKRRRMGREKEATDRGKRKRKREEGGVARCDRKRKSHSKKIKVNSCLINEREKAKKVQRYKVVLFYLCK